MEHFVTSFSLKEEAAKLKEGIPSRQKQRTPEDREHSARLIEFPPPTQPPKKSSSSI
jgi:hypothetical protein